MSFLDELKSRIESTRKQWEKAKKDAREAKEREGELYGKLTALQRVLQSEEKGSTHKKAEHIVPQGAGAPLIVDTLNKAEFVRDVIRRNPNGMTPAQVREALRASGVETNDTYVYSVLLRSKRTGRLRESNGKYFVDASDLQEKVAS
jgi:hypothetical protein